MTHDLEHIGNDVTAQLVHAMVLAGVAEAYGLTPHDDYDDDGIVAPARGSGDNSNKEGTDA